MMPMRNRRVRLLLLAVVVSLTFFLYSRSDPATIDQAKRYAERTYHQALDQTHHALDSTLGNKKGSQSTTSQPDAVNAALEAKKDEPFRVDFGAYSKVAELLAEETNPAAVPPPAAAAPVVKEPKEPKDAKTPAPVVVEPKKEDPMRVDFEHYSAKAALAGAETPVAAPGADPLNNPVIANPNPINAVAGRKDEVKPAKPAITAKPEEPRAAKPKGALVQQADKPGAVDPDMIGKGRVEVDVTASLTDEPVHWTKLVEKYPITSTNPYPYTDGKKVPQIQYNFKRDPASGGADAEKLAEIKAAALHSWKGYRDQAMGHDEVKPVSGKYANPFNAWGATLVDSLDTLWLMGFKEEFEDALTYVKKIDFTTSRRHDIPLFETTIRYLGGLLGAYEISGRNYEVLHDKIKQLGEILYGAFDTPNRMPMTYYKWKPDATDRQHRASKRTILAELGSLSLELSRLGQIIAEPKYYDAVARITHALAEWQDNTRIPGLWPTTLDASGCKRTSSDENDAESKKSSPKPKPKATAEDTAKSDANAISAAKGPAILDTGITAGSPAVKEPGIGKIAGFGNPYDEGSLDSPSAKDDLLSKGASAVKAIMKRAVDSIGFSKDDVSGFEALTIDTGTTSLDSKEQPLGSLHSVGMDRETAQSSSDSSCIPQGLTETDPKGSDIYTFGAAADSTYEYLPKMYLLLGARSDEYRKMYVKAAEASIKHLIYRPMIPDESRDILFAGNVDTKPNGANPKVMDLDFKPVMTHLTCFVGGMFGMAGKIFDRPQDVEMARKLTDGCIWAYNVTATGIMPEIMGLVKCDSVKNCKWDKTKYYKELDPMVESRAATSKDTSKANAAVGVPEKGALAKRQYGGGEAQYGSPRVPDVMPPAAATLAAEAPPLGMGAAGVRNQAPSVEEPASDSKAKPDFVLETKDKGPAAKVVPPPTVEKDTPSKPKADKTEKGNTHEEYVKKKIEDERLPPGVVGMYDKKYELRPEAIESVFYMYRITGEQYWRDRGWEMWNSVYKHTKATYGASAIDDVSKKNPTAKDREESFWLAETLKYFYLLFDDPDRVSLDDWVLNTEAHFLTRLGA